MATILYGKPVREDMIVKLKERVGKLLRKPVLAIVQVGEREDSSAYIKQKQKFGEQIGVGVVLKKFEYIIKEEELLAEIDRLNSDNGIDGIIVQLPLPERLNSQKIINSINPNKDADGLRQSDTEEDSILVTPATARAVMAMLDFYKVGLGGRQVSVIGRSRLAGGPIAKELEKRGAFVKICHKETENVPNICMESDLIVVAAGKTGLVTKDFVHQEQTIIDVGINRVDGRLVGDVAFGEVEPIVKAISPVPGGVGPLTVACLFENLLDLCYNRLT